MIKVFKKKKVRNFRIFNINFGPQHPSAHGVLRIVLEVKGEIIKKVDPHIGLLHRGTEKLLERKTYIQGLPYFDRLDYVSMMTQEHAFCLVIETLQKTNIPNRSKVIRVIFTEITRLLNHLLNITTHALDVGAMTPFLWAFEEREKLFSFYEKVSGARMHAAYFRPGGVHSDIPFGLLYEIYKFCSQFASRVDELEELLTSNRIWIQRLKYIGVISNSSAYRWSLTGPLSRSSGIFWDLRKKIPYEYYSYLNFKVPIGLKGDSYDRYLLRIEEMRQSIYIIIQSINKIKNGPINTKNLTMNFDKKNFKYDMEKLILHFKRYGQGFIFNKGSEYKCVESPKGEFGVFIKSFDKYKPYRCKIRAPGFFHLQNLTQTAKNVLISDLVTLIGTYDVVLGEIDR